MAVAAVALYAASPTYGRLVEASRGLRGPAHGLVAHLHGLAWLAAQAVEVARYRAGEKKLFGLLVGAAMREAKGADAGLVRKLLTEKLGG